MFCPSVEIVPTTRTAIITKGERLGAVDANPGDWILMNKTVGGWKAGVCYKWLSGHWINLEPEVNYTEEYQACLLHLFEIEEIANQTGRFGAVLCKMLVAQKALIDYLVVNKLKIDSDVNSGNDFEAFFDKDNGLKIKNKGKEIFVVNPFGKSHFEGDITTLSFELTQGNIESYTLSYNNELLAKIIKNNKYKGNQPIPLHGIYDCSGSYKGKSIIKISNGFSLAEKTIENVVINKWIKTEFYTWYYLVYGNVTIKTIKFDLTLFFSDNTKKHLKMNVF